VFEALSKGFREAQNRLAGLTELDEKNIKPALKEVRQSLLEADVELGVVKRFLANVEEKAIGQTLRTRVKHAGETRSVSAAEAFVKICHDELVELMSDPGAGLVFAEGGRTKLMMVGLQGSGKTTSSAKLAYYLTREKKKPLLVAADMQRPAAVEQLKVLGEKINVPVFNIPGETPVNICAAAEAEAKKLGCDVIIYDTAGRLAIDSALMQELEEIKAAIQPDNILLVVDAMIGQDAVQTARGFHDRLKLTGVVLTKLDGDARGGAALSVKEVTGAPVLFVGMGETTDKLEPFRPEGMASRVLGMGDVVGLMQDFEEVIDKKQAEEDAMRMLSGQFSLEDFLSQVKMIQKMGSLKDLVDKIPGMGGMLPTGINLDDKELTRIEAMIQSMTKNERRDPQALIREPSRVKRISRGSGQPEVGVGELVQKFMFMKQMMGGMGGKLGMMGNIPGLKQLAQVRNMKKAMKGGMPNMPGFPGMPGMGMPGMGGMGGLPGMGDLASLFGGMPGMGAAAPAAPRMKTLSRVERNAKKNQRKRERDARKKSKK